MKSNSATSFRGAAKPWALMRITILNKDFFKFLGIKIINRAKPDNHKFSYVVKEKYLLELKLRLSSY